MTIDVYYDNGEHGTYASIAAAEKAIEEAHAADVDVEDVTGSGPDVGFKRYGCHWKVELEEI